MTNCFICKNLNWNTYNDPMFKFTSTVSSCCLVNNRQEFYGNNIYSKSINCVCFVDIVKHCMENHASKISGEIRHREIAVVLYNSLLVIFKDVLQNTNSSDILVLPFNHTLMMRREWDDSLKIYFALESSFIDEFTMVDKILSPLANHFNAKSFGRTEENLTRYGYKYFIDFNPYK